MPKPTDEELEIALKTAISMRENGDDPFNLAKCLLSHNFRMKHMEQVLAIADRYCNMGMAQRELTHLARISHQAASITDKALALRSKAGMIKNTVCYSSMPITVQAGLHVRKLALHSNRSYGYAFRS